MTDPTSISKPARKPRPRKLSPKVGHLCIELGGASFQAHRPCYCSAVVNDPRHHLSHVELSDLIIDYDARTGERRAVRVGPVLDLLVQGGHRRSARIARRLPRRGDYFDEAGVDQILLSSHLELQRLSEEMRHGQHIARVLTALKKTLGVTPFVVVDVGCGLGYIIRHLAESGALGADTELIGVDYIATLLSAAARLAEIEQLPCRFELGNAFELDLQATVFISTATMHHFSQDGLAGFFALQQQAGAEAVMHFDIAPTWLAPIGAWMFHWARMRQPLARHDGVRSALRAHSDQVLVDQLRIGVPGWTPMLLDATSTRSPVINVLRPIIGMDSSKVESFRHALGPLVERLSVMSDST